MSVKIHIGDCREVMKGMKAGSAHVAITSPPYWGLRDYDTEPVLWGGKDDCEHVWGDQLTRAVSNKNAGFGERQAAKGQRWSATNPTEKQQQQGASASQGQFCQRCNCWRGNLGLEPQPSMFIDHLVEVMRGVWRVLRDDGILFLSLGDSYGHGTNAKRQRSKTSKKISSAQHIAQGGRHGGQSKQLLGIPWRVALALQADGWYLRSAIPWLKKNSMPESVRDRPTTAHEFVFMLTKRKRYYYDSESVKMPASISGWQKERDKGIEQEYRRYHTGESSTLNTIKSTGTRNRRTSDTFYESLDIRIEQQRAYLAHLEHVRANGGMLLSEDGSPAALLVNTASFSGAHFATFPLRLVKPLIACGSSERGACPECGSPWTRVVERKTSTPGQKPGYLQDTNARNDGERAGSWTDAKSTTAGWQPSCTCSGLAIIGPQPATPSQKKGVSDLDYEHNLMLWQQRMDKWRQDWASLKPLYDAEPVVHATVFDPFMGAGTTLLQADRMGRDAIGIELNETYARDLAYNRIAGDAPMFADVEIVA